MLRPRVAKLPSRPLRLLLKLGICTVVCLLLYGTVLRLLGLTTDLLESTVAFNLLLLVMGNLVFLLLDLALARLTHLWHRKLRRRLFR